MEATANALSYALVYGISGILGLAITDSEFSLFGLMFTSGVAGTIAFTEPPAKYYNLVFATGYMSGFAAQIFVRMTKKAEKQN